MASITKLTVVNACLATMGESPLNELEPDHPYVQVALMALDAALVGELGRGWWFNTDQMQLIPDAVNGTVPVPDDFLEIDTSWTQLVERGGKLFDRINQTYDLRTFMSQQGISWIDAVVIRLIPFEDLPLAAAQLCSFNAQLRFQASYDADSQRHREIGQQYQQVFNSLSAHNIRNSNVNILRSSGVLDKLNRISPMTTGGGGLKRWSRQ